MRAVPARRRAGAERVLHNCVIEIRAGHTLLGSGEATSTAGVSALTTEVTTTAAGAKYLKKRQLGAAASATLTAARSSATRGGRDSEV